MTARIHAGWRFQRQTRRAQFRTDSDTVVPMKPPPPDRATLEVLRDGVEAELKTIRAASPANRDAKREKELLHQWGGHQALARRHREVRPCMAEPLDPYALESRWPANQR
jgi:hypothetical protein